MSVEFLLIALKLESLHITISFEFDRYSIHSAVLGIPIFTSQMLGPAWY